jgi:hypothetical protein
VRLNGAIALRFREWINHHFPDRAAKVLSQIKECHGGAVNDSRFGIRMVGEGNFAEHIRQLHDMACRKYFKEKELPAVGYYTIYERQGKCGFLGFSATNARICTKFAQIRVFVALIPILVSLILIYMKTLALAISTHGISRNSNCVNSSSQKSPTVTWRFAESFAPKTAQSEGADRRRSDSQYLDYLKGKKVGILVNQTSIIGTKPIVDSSSRWALTSSRFLGPSMVSADCQQWG